MNEINQPNKIYGLADKHKTMPVVIGAILTICGFTFLFQLLPIGIMFILVSLIRNRIEIVRLYDDYSEVKLAPVGARWLIKNRAITDVSIERNVILLRLNETGKQEVTKKIPMRMFSEKDSKELIEHYKSLI